MKKLIKKIFAIIMTAVLFVGLVPSTGLEGILKFNMVEVQAAEADPFDTSKLIVIGSGKYHGIAWTTYNNGLLWVEDDKNSDNGNNITIDGLLEDSTFNWTENDIKYIYWNKTVYNSCRASFMGCRNVIEIRFGDAFINSTYKVTDMENMFYYCDSLEKMDVSKFNTSNVTDMRNMFANCSQLKSLDVSGFDTSKVTDMESMFSQCISLTYLDVSGFNTSNTNKMNRMFAFCVLLKNLDVSGFDTSKVTDMSWMFKGCYGLTSIDVSSFDTFNVTNMDSMFCACYGLKSIDLSGFNTSNVTNMSNMFGSCVVLNKLDLSGFNTSKVTDMSYMFSGCNALADINVSSFDTSKVYNMYDMFQNCNSLTYLDISSFNTSGVIAADYIFYGCSSLHLVDLPANVIWGTKGGKLPGVWYEITDNKNINKSTEYQLFPENKPAMTVIREFTHQCHNVTNGAGTCSLCGIKVIYGDNNDDGKVAVDDAVMIKKYLAGETGSTINLGAANVNADKKISVEDAVKLMQYLAGTGAKLGVAE